MFLTVDKTQKFSVNSNTRSVFCTKFKKQTTAGMRSLLIKTT